MATSSIFAELRPQDSDLHVEDLRVVLQGQGWQPTEMGPYLQCGDDWEGPGWRLHVAVTRSHFRQVVSQVVPLLASKHVSLRLFKNYELGNVVVNGGFGVQFQGKALSILPSGDQEAAQLAALLIAATESMKGPDVPGAYYLGGRVYTEYVDTIGVSNSYSVENGSRGLLRFFHRLQFELPRGVNWPFGGIVAYHPHKRNFLLLGRYLVVDMLKSDAKGHVLQAFQLGWRTFGRRVIKEGLVGINEDEMGRDAADRIRWQVHIAGRVKGYVRTPDVVSFVMTGRKAYMVSQWVPSRSLLLVIEQILRGRSWPDLEEEERERIKGYLLQVLDILNRLHELGIVHRDATPFNFFIDHKDQAWTLDLEQSYDRLHSAPQPPFAGGTPGYKRELDANCDLPSFTEDVFAFGGLMLFAVTGLFPHHFMGVGDKRKAYLFATENRTLTQLIEGCRYSHSMNAPSTEDLMAAINGLPINQITLPADQDCLLSTEQLTEIVTQALAGLHHPSMFSGQGYWKTVDRQQEKLYSGQWSSEVISPGLYDGVGGILLTIFKALRCGLRWNYNPANLNKNITFLLDQLRENYPGENEGLCHGVAGMRMVVREGLNAGVFNGAEAEILDLLEDSYSGASLEASSDLSLGNGLAGELIVLLIAGGTVRFAQATRIVMRIVELQMADGRWKNVDDSFFAGSTGILWSLMIYIEQGPGFSDVAALQAVRSALNRLIRKADGGWQAPNPWLDSGAGLALTFLKAFQIFSENKYLDAAANIFLKYPDRISSNLLTTSGGLSGLGEVYLHAWQITGNIIWYDRAGWIAQLLGHLFYRPQAGIGWWNTDRPFEPSAGLFTGSSGPLHFLLHYLYPKQMVSLFPGA
ncbi:hypothetical protein DCC81_03440 [Chitinophaga parva]|uniref:non-specific serine/threonine protein kinase n=1 Tax=Chitinophaga parva TaxID=2169414 RepID=A0A2T7BLJ6_9BACT|nr:lanthionine synthetase LanC family protein [Chitinophaga parva]PUZ28548.1 hypothetical protein DCC81_03440 [Chitinophaga parva]